MSKKRFNIVGIGEILWDVLPTGKQLGGAPANFAYISSQLGNNGIIASRIGNDADGKEILQELQNAHLDTSHLQNDLVNPTGTVKVCVQNGQPSYEITENVAWDFLELTKDWQDLAKNCDAVCFGSLAQRNSVSKKTIQEFIRTTRLDCLLVFDVNFRQNYFSKELVGKSLEISDVFKLNHEELPLIVEMFRIKGSTQEEQVKFLRERFALRLLCLTRGGNGSLLVDENDVSEHGGIKVEIADTIGAGDSFTATITHGVLHGWKLDEINEKANKIGAYVASQRGAMPKFTDFETSN